MKKSKIREVNLYIIVGILTTIINFLAFNLCLWVNINYKIANTIAFIISVIFAYIANKIIVFQSKTTKLKEILEEFIKFVGSRIFTYLFEMVSLIVFVEKLSIDKNISKIIIAVVVVILNYILSKTVFKQEEKKIG